MKTTAENGIVAGSGELSAYFSLLRRRRALFHLSVETPGCLVLGLDAFSVVASYDDDGYASEPLRAKVITLDHGETGRLAFDGGTPEDLIDFMTAVYDRHGRPQSDALPDQ